MSQKIDLKRCGQCGRGYTKAQWRRTNFYCPNCKKFVCYECTTRARICPACGISVDRTLDDIFLLTFLFGIILLPMGIYAYSTKFPDNSSAWSGFFVMILLPIGSIITAVYILFIFQKQKQNHIEYLLKMPPGIIPIEERPGAESITIKARIKEERLKRTPPAKKMTKQVFHDAGMFDLVGDWDFPVLSKEERIQYSAAIQKSFMKSFSIVIIIGIMLIVVELVIKLHFILLIFGIIALLLGLLFVSVIQYSKKMIQSDRPAEVKIPWKTVGQKKTIISIEEFLKEYGEDYKKKVQKGSTDIISTNPSYRYVFENGNYIFTTYTSFKDGSTMAWVAIGYKSATYSHAKKLQRELDKFLGGRDLIERS